MTIYARGPPSQGVNSSGNGGGSLMDSQEYSLESRETSHLQASPLLPRQPSLGPPSALSHRQSSTGPYRSYHQPSMPPGEESADDSTELWTHPSPPKLPQWHQTSQGSIRGQEEGREAVGEEEGEREHERGGNRSEEMLFLPPSPFKPRGQNVGLGDGDDLGNFLLSSESPTNPAFSLSSPHLRPTSTPSRDPSGRVLTSSAQGSASVGSGPKPSSGSLTGYSRLSASHPSDETGKSHSTTGDGSGRGDRAGQGKQAPLTLKEQESVIDHLTKDNFNLKLKISFLEERLMDMSPENMEKVLKENVEFKVRLQMVNSELESKNKLLMQARWAVETLEARDAASQGPDRETDEVIEHLREELGRARFDLEELRHTREWEAGELNMVIRQRNEAERLLDLANGDLRGYEGKLQEQEKIITSLQQEVDTSRHLAHQADQAEEEIGYLRDQLAEASLRLREVGMADPSEHSQRSEGTWAEEKDQLMSNLNDLRDLLERERKQSRMESLQRISQDAESEMSRVQQELLVVMRERDTLRFELREAKKEVEQGKVEMMDGKRVGIKEVLRRNDQLHEQFTELEERLDEAQEDCERLRESKKRLQGQYTEVKGLVADLEDRLTEAEELRFRAECREQEALEKLEGWGEQSQVDRSRNGGRGGSLSPRSNPRLVNAEARWKEEADARRALEHTCQGLRQEIREAQEERNEVEERLEEMKRRMEELELIVVDQEDELKSQSAPDVTLSTPGLGARSVISSGSGGTSRASRMALMKMQEALEREMKMRDETVAQEREAVRREFSRQKQRYRETQMEMMRLKGQVEQLKGLNEQYKAEVMDLPQRPQSVDSSLVEATEEMRQKLQALNRENNELSRDKAQLRQRLQRREEWIQKAVERISDVNERRGVIETALKHQRTLHGRAKSTEEGMEQDERRSSNGQERRRRQDERPHSITPTMELIMQREGEGGREGDEHGDRG